MSTLKQFVEYQHRIEYSYTPGYPQTQTDPECFAEVEIESVTINGVDILGSMSRKSIDELEELCMADFHEGSEER